LLIFDAHLDLAWNALNWRRDITRSIDEIRRSEKDMNDWRRGHNTVSLPEMRKAEVGICLATVLARCSNLRDPMLDYPSRQSAAAMGAAHVEYYRVLESQGYMRMLREAPALESHVEEWKRTGGNDTPLGFVLTMEGADPILGPDDIELWWERGLRVVEPVHYGLSYYAHGTGAPGGLTREGRGLLKAMDAVGMILDVTHLADESFWEALEIYQGPVLASHHNCRALVPGDRQLADEQIRALVKRDAVIGTALDSWMLHPNYLPGETDNSLVSIMRVVDHIDHICQLAGTADHCGIGSDLDGGFGTEQTPRELNTIADLQIIPDLLRQRGYRDIDVEGIMYHNWLRFFRQALPDH
jgi:membrane dipeptidase